MGESVGREWREKRVGTIGAIKKEKGRVYDLTNLTTERKILRWFSSISFASFIEILGEGGKVGVVDFLARKASGSRTIGLETSRRGAPLFYRESRDLWSGRCAPTPFPSPSFNSRRASMIYRKHGFLTWSWNFFQVWIEILLDCFRWFRWWNIDRSQFRDHERKVERRNLYVSFYKKIVSFILFVSLY